MINAMTPVVTLRGETNPVLCVLSCVRALKHNGFFPHQDINEESFRKLATQVKMPDDAPHFAVLNWGDVERLCKIGNFHVCFDHYDRLAARANNVQK